MPRVIGGRYGLVQRFHAGHGQGRLRRTHQARAQEHFTVGINDDVSHSSLRRTGLLDRAGGSLAGVFYGLGTDGTVGANKNRSRSSPRTPDLYAQGYFVYDSHKSGSETVSHLRFGPQPIRAPYLIERANFVACHQFGFLDAHGRAASRGAGRRVPAQQSLSAPTRSGIICRARCNSRSSRSACASSSSTPRRSPATSGSGRGRTRCCRRASSRSPACCRATRRSGNQGIDPQVLCAQGRRRRPPELCRRRRDAREPVRGRGSRDA